MVNGGGTAFFNPVWRLLAPDGSPDAGCGTFSGLDRTCTLMAAGAYAIEVEDSGFDGTGTYALSVMRAVPSCVAPSSAGLSGPLLPWLAPPRISAVDEVVSRRGVSLKPQPALTEMRNLLAVAADWRAAIQIFERTIRKAGLLLTRKQAHH